jgi:hypothetical protein
MLGALVLAAIVVTVLAGTLVLIPVAIALVIRWALIVPVTEVEEHSALGALRRSGRLVGRSWPKVACLTVLSLALVLLAGPAFGTLLVVFTTVPLSFANVIAGVVYAVLLPSVAITTAYVYFDARARQELGTGSDDDPDVLDAEIEVTY